MKKPRVTLLEFTVGLLVLGVAAAVPYSIYRPNIQRSQCQVNLRHVAFAIRQYAVDSNRRLPPVASNAASIAQANAALPYGWADAVLPYLKSPVYFQCPADAQDLVVNPWEPGYTDYFFNSQLAVRRLNTIIAPAPTVLISEGSDNFQLTTARYARRGIPNAWHLNPSSPASIHQDGCNFAFVDGHVKWLHRPKLAGMDEPCNGACFTFYP